MTTRRRAREAAPITFLVPGVLEPVPARGAVRGRAGVSAAARGGDGFDRLGGDIQRVRVGVQRGGGGTVRLEARPGRDAVVLHVAEGPSLLLHPETARELLSVQGASGGARRAARSRTAGEAAGAEVVAVPLRLGMTPASAATRGMFGDVLLSAVGVVKNLVKGRAAKLSAEKIAAHVDAQVVPGVYALGPEMCDGSLKASHARPLDRIPPAPDGAPLLVLLHGTFSETQGTFGGLWKAHSTHVQALCRHYGGRVYALEHPTLTASPIDNALALARALPKGARVHLLTHSRGGLVAEVLARLCGDPRALDAAASHFADPKYAPQREVLRALAGVLKGSGVSIDRVVRVACPARGTLLASNRLDAFMSIFKWALELAAIPVAPQVVDFIGEVAAVRTDPRRLPGLEAMTPDSALVQWLNASDAPLPGELRVLAGDLKGDSVLSWLKTLLADAFYGVDNDLVVQTSSMYGGAPRAQAPGAQFALEQGGRVSHFNYFSNDTSAMLVCNALMREGAPEMRPIGAMSWAGLRMEGLRAGSPGVRAKAAPLDLAHLPWPSGGAGVAPVPASGADAAEAAPVELQVEVINTNLKFVDTPLMLGHYAAMKLSGAEGVVDRFIGGTMSAALEAGLYPEDVGTHQAFVNRRHDAENPLAAPRPPQVIVVGLGEEGQLRSTELTRSVRQAALAWAQRVAEQQGAGAQAAMPFEVAATLMGSGGSGVSVGMSAQAIAQGVHEANERLAEGAWPQVGRLRLIELYLDRATEAWHALRLLAEAMPGRCAVAPSVVIGSGALRRPLDTAYRGAAYDFVSAVTERGEDGEPRIVYTADTRRARAEVRAQATQSRLVGELVRQASNDANRDPQIGGTLFKLLVPAEMETSLAGSSEMLIELDDGTAAIPWELFDAPDGNRGRPADPWAIRSKLLRRLRTVEFRARPRDARIEDDVLVIGEPLCDPTLYPPLLGARYEAEAVRDALVGPGGLASERVHALISSADRPGPDAAAVTGALLARRYRIVHIAGHGEPELMREGKVPQMRGVVLSDGIFLGPHEVAAMRVVPELVFLNCCHLAADADKLLRPYDRAAFAAGVAKQLIRIGVRCVVAAGWAVEDGPASEFASAFYRALLAGQRFMDAVHEARRAARAAGPLGNTWAAYQCYGDPDWVWRRDGTEARRPDAPVGEEFDGIASPVALKLALETLAVRSQTQGARPESQRAKIDHLEARFAAAWGGMGAVAEAFAVACAAAKATDRAIDWYRRAAGANDGSATVRAGEQLANLSVRRAWERVEHLLRAGTGTDDRRLQAVCDEGRADIVQAVTMLEALASVASTQERESLLGSAHKRLVMLETAAGGAAEARAALEHMARHYHRAEQLARENGDVAPYYPALNRMAAEWRLHAGDASWEGFDGPALNLLREGLEAKNRRSPDFWSLAGLPEIDLLEAAAARTLARRLPHLLATYEDLHERAPGPWLWASVRDQAGFLLAGLAKDSGAESDAARRLLQVLEGYSTG